MTLDDLRHACGLTVDDVTDRTDIARNTWYKYRNDPNPPKWLWLAMKAIYHRLD